MTPFSRPSPPPWRRASPSASGSRSRAPSESVAARADAAARTPARRCWPGEPLAAGLRRMALAQADLAIELLDDGSGTAAAARPTSGGARDAQGAQAAARAAAAARGRARREGLRSASSAALRESPASSRARATPRCMLSTLDELIQRHPRKLGSRRWRAGVAPAAARRARAHAAARAQRPPATTRPCSARCARSAVRVGAWSLSERADDPAASRPALERIYRQGRARHRRALRGKGDRTIATARMAQTRQGPALRRRNAARDGARTAAQARGASAARTAGACASWRAAPTSSANCSARSTTSRCSPNACARARATSSTTRRTGRGTRKRAAAR